VWVLSTHTRLHSGAVVVEKGAPAQSAVLYTAVTMFVSEHMDMLAELLIHNDTTTR
jgi:hypothetical protein